MYLGPLRQRIWAWFLSLPLLSCVTPVSLCAKRDCPSAWEPAQGLCCSWMFPGRLCLALAASSPGMQLHRGRHVPPSLQGSAPISHNLKDGCFHHSASNHSFSLRCRSLLLLYVFLVYLGTCGLPSSVLPVYSTSSTDAWTGVQEQ